MAKSFVVHPTSTSYFSEVSVMITVGIDVAKDKHDCCILSSNGEKISFIIGNNLSGFNTLLERILKEENNVDNIKVGLESTGHFSQNILKFLLNSGITTYLLNPLHAKDYRKSLLHRSTKTDKLDACILADMLMSSRDLKPYCPLAYHNEELKSLTRFRLSLIRQRAIWKTSVKRLVVLLFPELESFVSSIHSATIYKMLLEMPGASHIAKANLTRLTNLLHKASRGRFNREDSEKIREAARNSIGSQNPAQCFELQKTIEFILSISQQIDDVENEIKKYVSEEELPICSIPGMSVMAAAVIAGEIGDIDRFETPDKLIAFAGLSPTIYQSGKIKNCHSHMEKKGSKYLRHVLYLTARQMAHASPRYNEYLEKKRKEGKHYFVAISHVMKRLVRLIFAILKSGNTYCEAA